MDWPVSNETTRGTSPTSFDPAVMYKVVSAVLLIGLFHIATTKRGKPSLFPVWATFEIALLGYLINRGGLARRVLSALRRYKGSLFGLTSSHQLLVNLPGTDRLLSMAYHTVTPEPFQYTILTRVFGAKVSADLEKKVELSSRDLLVPIERAFVKDAAATSAILKADIPQKATSFVSFSTDNKHMKRWELSADIKVIPPDSPDEPGIVEANLQNIARDFAACIAVPLLYGQDFLDRYSQLMDDLWKFDNGAFPLLMIGVPTWAPFKAMKEGIAARSRLAGEMEALYRRIGQYQRGEPVDFGVDMSDISTVALERWRIYERDGWTSTQRGTGDLVILWGQNANTDATLFWFLLFIYSTPGVISRLRDEIAPHVVLSSTSPHTITSMDVPALSRTCPLLKACAFETYRLAVEVTSIRRVERPLRVDDGPLRHDLRPGAFVTVPHSLFQRDPDLYPDPDSFVPDRFIQTDGVSGKRTARYGSLKPWGAGAAKCKGRTFAEMEIMVAGAAIISLWNMAPAGGKEWRLPPMVPGIGVKKPTEEVRVEITRRKF